MRARIYKPARTAMQQGRAKTRRWVLDIEPQAPRRPDPLMGWASARDTTNQIRLTFDSKEEAIAYATNKGLDYVVREPHERTVQLKSYADNFRPDRVR